MPWGLALLACAAGAGFLLWRHPAETRLDEWGFKVLPARLGSPLYHDIAQLGSTPAFAVGVLLAVVIALPSDRRRALACLLGPLLAVGLTELVVKPLVGRQAMLGGFSYPSGTVASIAAVVTALALACRPPVRLGVTYLGAAAVLAVGAAVVSMRWHYPTDAMGGALIGVGTVLLVDGLLHVVPWPGRRPPVRAPATAGRR